MKNGVECYKDFCGYLTALKTNCDLVRWEILCVNVKKAHICELYHSKIEKWTHFPQKIYKLCKAKSCDSIFWNIHLDPEDLGLYCILYLHGQKWDCMCLFVNWQIRMCIRYNVQNYLYAFKTFFTHTIFLYKQMFSMIDVTTIKIVIIIIKAVHYLLVGDQTKLEIASAFMY
jgi:hypothetical protein